MLMLIFYLNRIYSPLNNIFKEDELHNEINIFYTGPVIEAL